MLTDTKQSFPSTRVPASGGLVQHYKGGLYRIQGSCIIESTLEPGVLYQAMDPEARQDVWMRPISDFLAEATPGKPRFSSVPVAKEDALRRVLPDSVISESRLAHLRAQYGEPGRFYHAWAHILSLFEKAESWGVALTLEQAFAILFHDVVYIPGAGKGVNERASANEWLAAASILAQGLQLNVARVAAIIQDTSEHTATTAASDLVLALDLSSLAGDALEFSVANELVWLENRHFFKAEANPRKAFDSKRLEFLERLASSGRVFPAGYEHLEAGFVRNLAQLQSSARTG